MTAISIISGTLTVLCFLGCFFCALCAISAAWDEDDDIDWEP